MEHFGLFFDHLLNRFLKTGFVGRCCFAPRKRKGTQQKKVWHITTTLRIICKHCEHKIAKIPFPNVHWEVSQKIYIPNKKKYFHKKL